MDRQPWLSASQIAMWLRCQRQYWYRYVAGIKIPPNGALKVGTVFHLTAERNYVQKVTSREDLPEDELTDYYGDQFEAEFQREEVRLQEGESKGALKDQGIDLIKTFAAGIAPHVQPVEVEAKFELNIGKGDENVLLKGRIDLVDENGVIRDNKTITRVPSTEQLAQDVQLSTYSLARRLITKKAEPMLTMDAAIKRPWPEARILPTARSREGLKLHLNMIGHIGKSLRAESFPINPTGWWCSRRWCGYYDRCVGRGLVTIDLAGNLQPLLEESLIGGKEKGEQEKGGEKDRQEASEAHQEGDEASGQEPDDAA